ncbi:hypothetical protein FZEAL_7295 [Fusarium zealandicum]|uniref:Rhodopsin domain-containing protein n=1 Tax=Fusarium zealandicum TaxID=1053134 RepID=A0A8H4UG24_9HYPO|nr:hypothetical protein FZEAL_7295 [Fusarium zealandicum]
MGDKGMGFPADGVDNQGWKLYITSLVMIITAGLFVIARCSTRYWMRELGWDDAAVVVSLLAVHNGYGMHRSDLSTAELRMALKMFFIAQTPYKATVCLNKVAAILLYFRLFVSTGFRISCFVVMGIIVAWSIGGIGATIWQCVPIEAAWNKSLEATCIDSNSFWVAYAVMNIVTDVMVLALPIVPIMRLQMNMRDRLLLCCVFLVGGLVTITSILRTTSVQNSLKNKQDITYTFIERGIWTLIEANLGIISACMPVLRRPLAKMFPRVFSSTKNSSAYSIGDQRGFNLSNVSAHASRSAFWRAATTSHQVVCVSGPDAIVERKSDERHIMDSESELDSRESARRGISRKIEPGSIITEQVSPWNPRHLLFSKDLVEMASPLSQHMSMSAEARSIPRRFQPDRRGFAGDCHNRHPVWCEPHDSRALQRLCRTSILADLCGDGSPN